MEKYKKSGPASTGIHESSNHYYEKYIDLLGLEEGQLKSKRILDLGGADGNFARNVGQNVVTLDFAADEYYQATNMAVTARAEQLPFRDGSFDLIVSSQALPFFYSHALLGDDSLEDLKNDRVDDIFSHSWLDNLKGVDVESVTRRFLDEQIRVLSVGGELRCAPIIDYPAQKFTTEYFKILDNILKEYAAAGKIEYVFENLKDDSGDDEDGVRVDWFRLVVKKK
jgi:ubiquinone/menaquinone biosynthesis C-methylase UbiE